MKLVLLATCVWFALVFAEDETVLEKRHFVKKADSPPTTTNNYAESETDDLTPTEWDELNALISDLESARDSGLEVHPDEEKILNEALLAKVLEEMHELEMRRELSDLVGTELMGNLRNMPIAEQKRHFVKKSDDDESNEILSQEAKRHLVKKLASLNNREPFNLEQKRHFVKRLMFADDTADNEKKRTLLKRLALMYKWPHTEHGADAKRHFVKRHFV